MKLPVRATYLAAMFAAVAAAGALALLAANLNKAEAQGIMSAPSCQCSAGTPIPGFSSRVAHCVCGGMLCAINESGESGKQTTLMQCVK